MEKQKKLNQKRAQARFDVHNYIAPDGIPICEGLFAVWWERYKLGPQYDKKAFRACVEEALCIEGFSFGDADVDEFMEAYKVEGTEDIYSLRYR